MTSACAGPESYPQVKCPFLPPLPQCSTCTTTKIKCFENCRTRQSVHPAQAHFFRMSRFKGKEHFLGETHTESQWLHLEKPETLNKLPVLYNYFFQLRMSWRGWYSRIQTQNELAHITIFWLFYCFIWSCVLMLYRSIVTTCWVRRGFTALFSSS